MDWNQITGAMQEIIDDIRDKFVIKNVAIRDTIFTVLESVCTVLYYPMKNEKNRGMRLKRTVNDKVVDFVYINTDKPIAEQIFAAAHELGHLCDVAERVRKKVGYTTKWSETEEEDITNRFAAELLMPSDVFRGAVSVHSKEFGLKNGTIKLEELIHIIVFLMNDFMTPYEAVRKRLLETGAISEKVSEFLEEKEKEIRPMVENFIKDKNTYLGKGSEVKTIPGIRELVEKAEENGKLDEYTIAKIKRDFEMKDTTIQEAEIEIKIEDGSNE